MLISEAALHPPFGPTTSAPYTPSLALKALQQLHLLPLIPARHQDQVLLRHVRDSWRRDLKERET
jgi:hypothetical protein